MRIADGVHVNDVQVRYHENATFVVLVAANGDYWLWFSTEPDQVMVSEFVSGNQLADAINDGGSASSDGGRDSEAKTYLEGRLRAAGYVLEPSSIEGRDLAVWRICVKDTGSAGSTR